jgi:sporulation protein YlmC with PRC-barrel domain
MGQMPENRLEAYMPMGDLEKTRDFNFTDIRGFKVHNTTGHKVGMVKDVYVDPNTLEPCFALLHYEKFMNSNVKDLLVPWEELILGEGMVQTRPAEPGFERPHHEAGHAYDPIEDEMEEPLGARGRSF